MRIESNKQHWGPEAIEGGGGYFDHNIDLHKKRELVNMKFSSSFQVMSVLIDSLSKLAFRDELALRQLVAIAKGELFDMHLSGHEEWMLRGKAGDVLELLEPAAKPHIAALNVHAWG